MKKIIKSIICLALCSCMLLALCSCGKSIEEEIIGNWECETTSNWMWLNISEGGKCSMFIMDMNTAKSEMEEGTWTLDGETLTCDIDSMKFEFTYKDGKLVLGDKLEFTKMAKKPEV